ncbi:MAG: c-type cytochrome [bacterium]
MRGRAQRTIALAGALSLIAIGAGWWFTIRPRLSAAERGRRLAEHTGCFGCHGPEGTRGTPNAGRKDGPVPTFGSELMMYASSESQIREWIRDGAPASRAQSATFQEQRRQGALRMPAFGKRLSKRQIDDLVQFVQAVNGTPEPQDSVALGGLEAARRLGCFGCHGPGGRFERSNPGSLKGYVPSWDGDDFPDLVRDRAEFTEWVRDGSSARFAANPAAKFFLRRAVLHMPAYKDKVAPQDVDALWAYVQWLRERDET